MINDYTIREITINDTNDFWHMLCELDNETDFMMYEPHEREASPHKTDVLENNIRSALNNNDLFLLVETKEDGIVGFISAKKGNVIRTAHSAYIVIGIRSKYQNMGIGKKLFTRLNDWARANKIIRLELTVNCNNDRAKPLYELKGFGIEGIRQKSMFVNGEFIDEYYMSKIFER